MSDLRDIATLCKEIDCLTAQVNTLRGLLDYEPETGIFHWRVQPSRNVKAGVIAGTLNHDGYIRIMVNGKKFLAHRLAYLHFHGVWPEQQIDHLNGDKSDNRIANLRDVSPSINSQNQTRPRKSNASGFLGVSWNKDNKRWMSKIKVNGRSQHLGYFSSPEVAHAAYLAAKLRLHLGDIRHFSRLPSLPIPTTLFERTA
jgi:hypothetical protein